MGMVAPLVDRVASLLEYPDGNFQQTLADCLIHAGAEAGALERFASGVRDVPLARLQEAYTQTFDLNAACTLDMGWHLFGDRPERGAFMAEIRSRLAAVGIDEGSELPDYLPHVLKLIARMDPPDAAALRGALEPAIARLCEALAARESAYEHLVTTAFSAVSPGA